MMRVNLQLFGGRGGGSGMSGGGGSVSVAVGTPAKIAVDVNGTNVKPNSKGMYNVSGQDLSLQQVLDVADRAGMTDMTKKTAGRALDPAETVLEMSVKYKDSKGDTKAFDIRILNEDGEHLWGRGTTSGKSSSKDGAIRSAKNRLKEVITKTW